MGSEKRVPCRASPTLFFPGFALVAALLAGCGGPRTEAELREQAVSGIDARRYAEVIDSFEGDREARPSPLGDESRWLLAQAHLGAAGFEPMRIQAAAFAPQRWRRPGLATIYAKCPVEAVPRPDGIPPKCLFKRLANVLPDAGNPHLARAIELFVSVYPDPERAPRGRNVLIGAAFLGRAIARAAVTLEAYRALPTGADAPEPDPKALRAIFEGIGAVATDASEALRRAKHSPQKVSQLLAGSAPDLEAAQTSVLPQLIELGRPGAGETPETAMLKLGALQKVEELLSEP